MNIAFFDVDETLIECKSMFVFAEFYFDTFSNDTLRFDAMMAQIHRQVENGATREDINRFYYRCFSGHAQQVVRTAAQELYDSRPFPRRANVVERLYRHQQAGDEIVFVSGAMVDILHPLMTAFGVRTAYCSTPEVSNGQYTGELSRQAIGAGKIAAVSEYCAALDVPPERCYAYGDHISDVALLSSVGHGVAVNPDAAMTTLAASNGWEILN